MQDWKRSGVYIDSFRGKNNRLKYLILTKTSLVHKSALGNSFNMQYVNTTSLRIYILWTNICSRNLLTALVHGRVAGPAQNLPLVASYDMLDGCIGTILSDEPLTTRSYKT